MSNKNIKMGKVSLPLDVRSSNDIPAFEKMLEGGPMAIVLVYADWCGHCDKYKKNVWNPLKSMKNKTMNMASVHYDQLNNTSLSSAKLEGYPSVLVVGKDKIPATFNSESGNTNAIPTSNNVSTMKRLVTTPVPSPMSQRSQRSQTINRSQRSQRSQTINEDELPDIIVPNETNTTVNNITPPNINEDETNVNSKTEGVNITRNGTLKNNTQGTTPLLRGGGRLYSRMMKSRRKRKHSYRKRKN